jgi:hypothetical protein
VKRIVVTSSVAAIRLLSSSKPFTEADWNDESVDIVNKEGKGADASRKYEASKTLAEKGTVDAFFKCFKGNHSLYTIAAWKVYEENKKSIQWDLVTINPPYVLGVCDFLICIFPFVETFRLQNASRSSIQFVTPPLSTRLLLCGTIPSSLERIKPILTLAPGSMFVILPQPT